MPNNRDPVERALQSLGGRSWPGMAHDPQLEQKLMESFAIRNSATFLTRHRVMIPTFAVLVLATAAFAAAGGVGLVKSWFATVEVDGQVVHSGQLVSDENGQATIRLPDGSLPAGEHQLTVTLDGDAPPVGGTTTVTITAVDDGATVQTSTESAPAPDKDD